MHGFGIIYTYQILKILSCKHHIGKVWLLCVFFYVLSDTWLWKSDLTKITFKSFFFSMCLNESCLRLSSYNGQNISDYTILYLKLRNFQYHTYMNLILCLVHHWNEGIAHHLEKKHTYYIL
jgi:hypothetical protein